MSDNTNDQAKTGDGKPTPKVGVFHTVKRPGNTEAVYTRRADGSVTRAVRKVKAKG